MQLLCVAKKNVQKLERKDFGMWDVWLISFFSIGGCEHHGIVFTHILYA